MIKSKFSLV